MSRKPSDFRCDIAPWARWVAEAVKLAQALPDGQARLKAFSAGGGFCEEVEQIEAGVIVVFTVPTARSITFLEELRAAAAGGRAA